MHKKKIFFTVWILTSICIMPCFGKSNFFDKIFNRNSINQKEEENINQDKITKTNINKSKKKVSNNNDDKPIFVGLANPWIECKKNFECANKKAKFYFRTNFFDIENIDYNIRASKNMIEIKFVYNSKDIIFRASLDKSSIDDYSMEQNVDDNYNIDISGDYNYYPIKKDIVINDKVITIRGNNEENKIFVANFNLLKENKYTFNYSIMSKDGLNQNELATMYNILKNAETKVFIEENNDKSQLGNITSVFDKTNKK